MVGDRYGDPSDNTLVFFNLVPHYSKVVVTIILPLLIVRIKEPVCRLSKGLVKLRRPFFRTNGHR